MEEILVLFSPVIELENNLKFEKALKSEIIEAAFFNNWLTMSSSRC
jgi:hypothetical protein